MAVRDQVRGDPLHDVLKKYLSRRDRDARSNEPIRHQPDQSERRPILADKDYLCVRPRCRSYQDVRFHDGEEARVTTRAPLEANDGARVTVGWSPELDPRRNP